MKSVCEVKTINVSEIEAERRRSGGVAKILDQLESGFFLKLRSDLAKAKCQMEAYATKQTTKKVAYVVVNFDDSLHEYADRYEIQIAQFLDQNPELDLDIVFDIKPASS